MPLLCHQPPWQMLVVVDTESQLASGFKSDFTVRGSPALPHFPVIFTVFLSSLSRRQGPDQRGQGNGVGTLSPQGLGHWLFTVNEIALLQGHLT